jgi:hypothetical protein
LLGSIHPNWLATNKKINKKTDRIILTLRALNILSDPAFPPFKRPITAEPKKKKISTSIAMTNKLIIFLIY